MLAVVLIAGLTVFCVIGNTTLETNTIDVYSEKVPEAFDGYRILQVSDLHDALFGEDNCELIEAAAAADPDIIVITGDFIDHTRITMDRSLHVAEELVKIAPVYYVTGNHERKLKEDLRQQLYEGLETRGVTYLNDRDCWLEKDGSRIHLAGLKDLNYRDGNKNSKKEKEAEILQSLHREDCFEIVLSHRPELLELYADAGADLVFTGHAHGGQFRLPFIGGLYAPNQGLFPQYTSGLYHSGKTQMIVSRGLGNSDFPIRFNNTPELVLAVLHSGSEKE